MLKDFTKETFDIIIQAGQSNAEGYGCGPVEKPYQPKDTVCYLDKDLTITKASERVRENEIYGNFALSFADRYLKDGRLKEGRKLLIVRSAVAGTGFFDHRWGMEDDLYLQMMEMIRTALSLNPNNRVVAFLWHQGETDALGRVSYDVHYNNLFKLFSSVRIEFNIPKIPFITGSFVPYWISKRAENCAPILEAIKTVCNGDRYSFFVETEGLLSNVEELKRPTLGWSDDIHFSRKSLYELGNRYYDAFLKLTEETK